jgi:signal peptidase I
VRLASERSTSVKSAVLSLCEVCRKSIMPYSQQEPASETAAKSGDRQELVQEVFEFAKMVVWFVVLFVTIKAFVIEGYEVQGESMEPNLVNGDRILVLKLPLHLSRLGLLGNYDPLEPHDIVVFLSPDDKSKRFVKRIIAEGPKLVTGNTVVAGEHGTHLNEVVSVKIASGRVYVDNRRISEPYLPYAKEVNEAIDEETLLTGGEYYVLGDHRDVSKDSRVFGPINDGLIIGKAVLRFWPLNRISLLQ